MAPSTKTTTHGIASALVRARDAGGISESELTALVTLLVDGAMALDVDAESSSDRRIQNASDLLGDLATSIEDRS